METRNVILAVVLSVAVVLGYQAFLAPRPPAPAVSQAPTNTTSPKNTAVNAPRVIEPAPITRTEEAAPDYRIDPPLFSATINGRGAVLKSFTLKKYRTSMAADSGPVELVRRSAIRDMPLLFSWGVEPGRTLVPVMTPVARTNLSLTLTGQMPSGLKFKKTFEFDPDSYLFRMRVEVTNPTSAPLQGSPYLSLPGRIHKTAAKNSYLFSGPALLLNNTLEQVKTAKLIKKGDKTFTGKITWLAFEDTYFMTGVIPEDIKNGSVKLSASAADRARLLLYAPAKVL